MNKLSQLDPTSEYVVELRQCSEGHRTYSYRKTDELPHKDCFFETEPASGEQFIKFGYYEYSKHLKLTNGNTFGFEAHGIWLLDYEIEALEEDLPFEWSTKQPPKFPPK